MLLCIFCEIGLTVWIIHTELGDLQHQSVEQEDKNYKESTFIPGCAGLDAEVANRS